MNFMGTFGVALVALAAFLSGCGKKDGVDTGKLEASFQSAEPQNKSSAEQAVAAIRNENYAGAVAELQKLAAQAKLTPEQQQAIKDVLAQIKTVMAEKANQVADEAGKALGDMQKKLPQ